MSDLKAVVSLAIPIPSIASSQGSPLTIPNLQLIQERQAEVEVREA